MRLCFILVLSTMLSLLTGCKKERLSSPAKVVYDFAFDELEITHIVTKSDTIINIGFHREGLPLPEGYSYLDRMQLEGQEESTAKIFTHYSVDDYMDWGIFFVHFDKDKNTGSFRLRLHPDKIKEPLVLVLGCYALYSKKHQTIHLIPENNTPASNVSNK